MTGNSSLLVNRLKTAGYALLTIVLAGWVTEALNEGLIFKMIVRQIYPVEVQNYTHPFDTFLSFLIWFIPLFVTLILMFGSSLLTVHHFKKRHIYRLSRVKGMENIEGIIIAPNMTQIERVCSIYRNVRTIHILVIEESNKEQFIHQIKQYFEPTHNELYFYTIKNSSDLLVLKNVVEKIIDQIIKQFSPTMTAPLCFDLTCTSATIASAAMFCALEQDITLVQEDHHILKIYDLVYEVDQ